MEEQQERQLNDTDKEIYHHWPCKGPLVGPAQDPWRVFENQERSQERNTGGLTDQQLKAKQEAAERYVNE